MTAPPTPDPAAVRAALDRLTATVAGMTPGEWEADPSACCIYAADSDRLLTIRDGCDGTRADLHGAIALRNAADALVAVARAAAEIEERCTGSGAARNGALRRELRQALAALAAAVPGAGGGE